MPEESTSKDFSKQEGLVLPVLVLPSSALLQPFKILQKVFNQLKLSYTQGATVFHYYKDCCLCYSNFLALARTPSL